jgi:hypothetical protein
LGLSSGKLLRSWWRAAPSKEERKGRSLQGKWVGQGLVQCNDGVKVRTGINNQGNQRPQDEKIVVGKVQWNEMKVCLETDVVAVSSVCACVHVRELE